MSQQHFYSRVPARMSVFNRADGFDTFAYSEGLDRTFIEKDLAAIYDNKPSKNDAVLIRDGKLPPVYCQYFTKSGVFTQGCISYLPLDYTKERSAYLSHILVPNGDEEELLLDNIDNASFNPDMFKKDLSGFSLTEFDSTPDKNYPLKEYKPVKAQSTDLLSMYDSAMMKRLIFCMLNFACGRGKTVFVSLPFHISEFSEKSLEFINTLIQIFPYHMRRAFSFVTYTDDFSRYSAFNIRFIPEGAPEIPVAKGITLHFASKIALGLSDEMVASSGQLVSFFYSLLKNDAIRREFIYFMNDAIKAVPELKKVNLKTLNELVFVFQQCSGLFNEKSILPNDSAVFDFVCAYEKHRAALSGEYRSNALKCLKRYPENHQAIPKDLFNRISKIYPTETVASKHNILSVVLELIHTDVMREKLFSFIKNNYYSETPENRSEICNNLCRVYYGGFLQIPILTLFEQIFSEESDDTKNNIVERLLLTVRTPAISMQIISFFDKNYDILTDEQKQKLYSVFYEMLPDCDDLTTAFVKLINAHIETETDDFKTGVKAKVFALCNNNQHCAEPKLLSILIAESGFCTNAVTEQIFTNCAGKKIFERYVEAYKQLSGARKLNLLSEIWEAAPDMTVETAENFANSLFEAESNIAVRHDLYSLIEIDKVVTDLLDGSKAQKAFATICSENAVRPALFKALPEAFSVKRKSDGLQLLINYAKDRPYITFSEKYKPVSAFIKICNAAGKQNDAEVIELFPILDENGIRLGAAEHIKRQLLDSEVLTDERFDVTCFVLKVMNEYLKSHEFKFSEIFSETMSAVNEKLCAEGNNVNFKDATQEASRNALGTMLKATAAIYSSQAFSENKDSIVSADGPLKNAISIFLSNNKKGAKWIDEYLSFGKFNDDFSKKIIEIVRFSAPKPTGLFGRIFGQK